MQIDIHGASVELDGSVIGEPSVTVLEQLREYERGERQRFDLTVEYPDSFTGEVMRAMAAIPYGETRTYGELATSLETAPVAVGSACGRNPVPIVVPCHRVVGHDSLGGFSAGGDDPLGLKRQLLEHEAPDGPNRSLESFASQSKPK